MMVSLLEDPGYATVELLLSAEREPSNLPRFQRIVVATADALERVLGAPVGCLQQISHEELAQWLVPLTLSEGRTRAVNTRARSDTRNIP